MGIAQIFGGLAAVATIFGLKPATLAAIVGGVVVPSISFIGGAVWWFHQRIKQLEKESEDREAVVYGGENNPLNIGLVKEVKSLKQDFQNAENERENLQLRQEEILDRLEKIEQKLDKYNDHGDDSD